MKDHLHSELKKEFQLERLILFSDAVFAIAITLLIIEIKVPELHDDISNEALWHQLDHLIPKFVGFLISFLLIGIFWSIHHRLFGFVVNYNARLIALNLFFLFTIVLMPFSTGLFGEYSAPKTMHLLAPFAIYVSNICLTGFANYLLWNYIGNPAHKLAEGFPDQYYVADAKRRALIVPSFFLLSLIVAFFNPILARYIPILIAPAMSIINKYSAKQRSKIAAQKNI